MDSNERDALAEIREAMTDPNVSLHFVVTFGHGTAVQVKIKTRKIGPMLFPGEGDDLGDVLKMLGTMRAEGAR